MQDEIDKLTAHNTLPRLAGPVASNLTDSVLHKYKIYPQAYRIRAFIKNHCHKYLMAKVYQGICDSVVTKVITGMLLSEHKQFVTSLKT